MAKTSKSAAKTKTAPVDKTSAKPASSKLSVASPRNAASGRATAAAPIGGSLTPQVTMTLNHDQIAKRAFAIWVAKGRPHGQDEQNWKEAEALLARDLAKRA